MGISDTFLPLRCGPLNAFVAPGIGGSLAAFAAHGEAMMRPFDPSASIDPLAMACFPLVPFSNRIARGRFSFGGKPVALVPDPESMPHALHGLGWRHPWKIETASGSMATLVLRHESADGRGWPWSFEARETFALDGEALTISLMLLNRAAYPMPAGLGLHPFFPGSARARIAADLPFVWETTPDRLPARRVAVPPEWDFADGRAVAPLALDNCFSGGGSIAIEWKDRAWALSIECHGADHTVIYTPPEHDFFCVEPVSHMPDAVNRPENANVTGLRVLAPGEEMHLSCRFAVVTR